jgi:G3E family GTPase
MMRVPVTVLTGFLGAGKTTLLRSLLTQADGKRIAVIVNEFGDAGFDGGLVAECASKACAEGDIIELTNGCICCTVADDFVPTMEKLLSRDRQLDAILIETSGLALPQPLLKAFAWPAVRTRATVDGVVTVVDALALSEGRIVLDEAALTAQREADAALDHDDHRSSRLRRRRRAAAIERIADCVPMHLKLTSEGRTLAHEISRVVRGRAANPKWLAGVMRHGYKGAFEIAATVDYLFGFAATTDAVSDHHFDQLFAAYVENEAVRAFMTEANPSAFSETVDRFQEAIRRGLWHPRSNSAMSMLATLSRRAKRPEGDLT